MKILFCWSLLIPIASSFLFDRIFCIDPFEGEEEALKVCGKNWKQVKEEFKRNTSYWKGSGMKFGDVKIHHYEDYSYNVVDESGSKGTDFLSHVCDQWEKAALDKLGKRTQRLVLLRIGIVLESNSGMLSKMIVPFKLCLGAIIGSGKQYIPWIHINDIVGIINYLINSDIKGPVNLVSPKIDNNFDFSKKLGRALHRIVMLRVPSFLITLLLGEMSTMVLKSSNIKPDVILKSDYKFEFENLDDALNDLLS